MFFFIMAAIAALIIVAYISDESNFFQHANVALGLVTACFYPQVGISWLLVTACYYVLKIVATKVLLFVNHPWVIKVLQAMIAIVIFGGLAYLMLK